MLTSKGIDALKLTPHPEGGNISKKFTVVKGLLKRILRLYNSWR